LSNVDPDAQFFADHPDRKAHIRVPRRQIYIDKQRATRFMDECEVEFRSLGDHDHDRRRILLTRSDHRGMPIKDNKVLKIPFLLYSDETVEDTDEVLLPIIFEIMAEAAEHGSAR
jgi:hypothetical protein